MSTDPISWYRLSVSDALARLRADGQRGLSADEAARRLGEHGPNELVERGGRTPLQILWEQLTATMVLILIVAAVISALLGDTKNFIAILAIVILYAVLGFVQEYRAEQAIAALKRLAVPVVRVLRDGQWIELSARELVPGDVIALEAGNLVPADCRLLEAASLRVQEAALTGESEPVEKQVEPIDRPDLTLGDRRNQAFLGTVVTQGRGRAVVAATGMETELGRIAELIQQVAPEQTPLQRRLDGLGKLLAWVGLAIAALIFALGLLRGDELRHMLLTAVSVAVAVVPEGLPAVVTITLALGAQSMLRRNALIRRLPAVETLGSVTVICSDKTGTLTENRMTVVVMDVADHRLDLNPAMRGDSALATRGEPASAAGPLSLMAIGGALCNDATLVRNDDQTYQTLGDPTEGALVVAAGRMGYWKPELESAFPRAGEVPFNSERRRMTTVHALGGFRGDELTGLHLNGSSHIAFTKGAVDGLLEIASHVWVEGRSFPLDDTWRARILQANEDLAGKGMRVLGVALRLFEGMPARVDESLESGLTFVGLFGMIDPPRREVEAAVRTCRAAGIRPVMITGDHPLTALEIARQLGIAGDGQSLTGAQLERMSDEDLQAVVEHVSVYARVSPEHKLRIVQALQARGHIVSMTGDGVNDAPALRRADIGVAMGITGTDVSKEASDLVLLDDNFATIVAAVEQGRVIYDNIRRFVRFSVAGNLGKVLVMIIAPFLGKPIPLLPLQLLWLNLLTDGLLGLGIGVEPAERDTMKRAPYAPGEGVFSRGGLLQVGWVGALIGALTLGLGAWYFFTGRPEWQTVMFTALAFAQVGQALAARSSRDSFFARPFSNLPLLGLAVLVLGLQMLAVYLPFFNGFFETLPLAPADLAWSAAAGLVVFAALEIEKLVRK